MKNQAVYLNKENTKFNLEDRLTYLLSELLNDNSPIGQEAYRFAAKKVITEVNNFKIIKHYYEKGAGNYFICGKKLLSKINPPAFSDNIVDVNC